jgi:nitroreductase
MTLLEICKKRFSVRSFQKRTVSDEELNYLLEAARFAPSAVNLQPWHFIVIKADENRQALHECYHREWFKSAPLYIVVCADHYQSWKRKDEKDFADVDVAIAIEHISLAATEIGLGTCWVCNFDPLKLHQTLSLPDHIEPIAIIPVGYPDLDIYAQIPIKLRKPLSEIVHWEKF